MELDSIKESEVQKPVFAFANRGAIREIIDDAKEFPPSLDESQSVIKTNLVSRM